MRIPLNNLAAAADHFRNRYLNHVKIMVTLSRHFVMACRSAVKKSDICLAPGTILTGFFPIPYTIY